MSKQNKISPNRNNNNNIIPALTTRVSQKYSVACPDAEIDRAASAKTTMEMHNGFTDIFTSIGCLMDSLTFKDKDDTRPYKAFVRSVHICFKIPSKRIRKDKSTTNNYTIK